MLHEQITNSNVSDTCRVLILCRVVSLLLDEEHEKKAKKRGDSVEQSFKLLVPLMAAGLESARELQLDSNDLSDAKKGLLDNLWGNVCILLTKTLTPTTTPNGSKLLKFQHAVEMVDLVRISSKNGPIGYTSRLCAILSAAASKCLDAAKAYSAKDLEDANLQKHREESLNLFAACFRGVCCLQPKYKNLKITAEQVLTSTMKLLSGQGDRSELEPSKNVNVLCCLLICNVMQETVDVEHLAIAVFPLLCQLVAVGAEDPQLRQALGGVLAKVDVAKVLEENQARCEEAEERALKAEIKVSELSLELEKVHKEKEALERQLALL